MNYKKPDPTMEDQLASEYIKEHEEDFQILFDYILERDKCKDIKYIGMRHNLPNGDTY